MTNDSTATGQYAAGRYDVAAYVWPAYTGEEKRARIFWEEGIGEWQTVKKAAAKFKGHSWPRKPLWGYVNEADPCVMEMQINAAADHGVNVFIYDWYWYDGLPYLEQCLNNGFLKAKNNGRMKFYLMWANHMVNLTWDKRNSEIQDAYIWTGQVSAEEFEKIGVRLIENYFKHPLYYRIDGKPVFMLYDLSNFAAGLGGMEKAKSSLHWLKEEAVRRGLPGIHFQFVKWGDEIQNISGVDSAGKKPNAEIVQNMCFDSLTHYQFVHFTDMNRNYAEILEDVWKEWAQIDRDFQIPYFPHISIGWDNNPRFNVFRNEVVKNNPPELFEAALRRAKKYLDAHPNQAPLITINSWNEWTETSYLEPDDLYGYGYLEAVKRVFADAQAGTISTQ